MPVCVGRVYQRVDEGCHVVIASVDDVGIRLNAAVILPVLDGVVRVSVLGAVENGAANGGDGVRMILEPPHRPSVLLSTASCHSPHDTRRKPARLFHLARELAVQDAQVDVDVVRGQAVVHLERAFGVEAHAVALEIISRLKVRV